MIRTGANAIMERTIECVGPRCWISPKCWSRMSASGIMDSVKMSGMLRFVLSSFDDVLPRMYPRARCPTAKRGLFLLSVVGAFPVIKGYSHGWASNSRQFFDAGLMRVHAVLGFCV